MNRTQAPPSWCGVCRAVAVGPLLPFAAGAFHRRVSQRVACRVPARQPGNFHLRPQMKVTKAKGLNTHLVSTPCAPSRTGGLDASRCVNPAARSAGPCHARAGHPQAHGQPMQPAQMDIEVVCFGDFHLDQQMKVTRLPGRDPACNALRNTSMKRAQGERQQRAASDRRKHDARSIAADARRNGPLT
jgi:hypothetical protein